MNLTLVTHQPCVTKYGHFHGIQRAKLAANKEIEKIEGVTVTRKQWFKRSNI